MMPSSLQLSFNATVKKKIIHRWSFDFKGPLNIPISNLYFSSETPMVQVCTSNCPKKQRRSSHSPCLQPRAKNIVGFRCPLKLKLSWLLYTYWKREKTGPTPGMLSVSNSMTSQGVDFKSWGRWSKQRKVFSHFRQVKDRLRHIPVETAPPTGNTQNWRSDTRTKN